MKKHNKNIARTEEDFTLGILKGKTIFPYGYPGKKQMTMNTPAGVVPFPIEYIGITNGKITDRGIALPGEDFVVNGDTVIEKQINMKNRYNTSLEEDFKKHRQELGNKGLEPMSYGKGGKMPQWLAEARFKAAGEEDKMDDYGYMKGGELSRLKAMKEKLYKKYQEGGDMMEEEMSEEVAPYDVVEETVVGKKPTSANTISIEEMVMSELLDKISTGQTFTPRSIMKLTDAELDEEDATMIADLFNNAIKMIQSKDIDVSDDEVLFSFIDKLGILNSPLVKSLYESAYGAGEEMEEIEEEVEEMPSNKQLTFSQAYAQAKQKGLSEFMWQGSKYKTNLTSQPSATEEIVEEEEIEEEPMENEVSDEEMDEIAFRLERLKELQQKALGGYANTPYMSQIPTGDEMGEYTPFSKYRDNNRNYKRQAGINDFLGKAMFMGQKGFDMTSKVDNTYSDQNRQAMMYMKAMEDRMKRQVPSEQTPTVMTGRGNYMHSADTIPVQYDNYIYYPGQESSGKVPYNMVYPPVKGVISTNEYLNKYSPYKKYEEGGNVPAWFENTNLDPSAQDIIRQGWDYSYDWKNPEVGGYGNDYYRYDEMKKGGYLTKYQSKGYIEPTLVVPPAGLPVIVEPDELPIGEWKDMMDLQDEMQQYLDYQNNLRINQNEKPLDFNKLPENPNERKYWNQILKGLKEGVKSHREHYKNKIKGPSAFDQHMKMMRQCDDYNPPVMKKGGYATPKYSKGQTIQYKQGGKVMTGVVDSYNPKTGQIKLK